MWTKLVGFSVADLEIVGGECGREIGGREGVGCGEGLSSSPREGVFRRSNVRLDILPVQIL